MQMTDRRGLSLATTGCGVRAPPASLRIHDSSVRTGDQNENHAKERRIPMKKIATAVTILGVSVLLLATDALGQGFRWRGGGGWGPGGQYGRLYDAKTVETVNGEVTSVQEMIPFKGMGNGVHLMLKTDTETLSVHLGPVWYVERQDTEIDVGDKIDVKGSRISYEGKPAIIAAEIHKGDEVLMLRDATGIPMWAGWRRSP
jgi:hypothetical protein